MNQKGIEIQNPLKLQTETILIQVRTSGRSILVLINKFINREDTIREYEMFLQ